MADAIIVEDLRKQFGSVVALDGVSFSVPTGTVLGLLGPNGAGKTTSVRVLTTILAPDSGRAEVLGLDVTESTQAVRESIGLAGQYAAVDENLTGHENLRMVGRLSHLAKPVVLNALDRAARAVLALRRGRPPGAHVLRRDAPPARPRGRAPAPPAGSVPRRADDRPRPERSPRPLGRDRGSRP